MEKSLNKAFEEASKLPEDQQKTLAAWLLHEIESERQWAKSFAESEDVLVRLAEEALAEHRAGRTKKLDPDGL